MPRPGPRRPAIALRLSAEGLAFIDKRAIEEGLVDKEGRPNRSEMIRVMLAHASLHMPKGWRKPGA